MLPLAVVAESVFTSFENIPKIFLRDRCINFNRRRLSDSQLFSVMVFTINSIFTLYIKMFYRQSLRHIGICQSRETVDICIVEFLSIWKSVHCGYTDSY